jgi:hypothetical protein
MDYDETTVCYKNEMRERKATNQLRWLSTATFSTFPHHLVSRERATCIFFLSLAFYGISFASYMSHPYAQPNELALFYFTLVLMCSRSYAGVVRAIARTSAVLVRSL